MPKDDKEDWHEQSQAEDDAKVQEKNFKTSTKTLRMPAKLINLLSVVPQVAPRKAAPKSKTGGNDNPVTPTRPRIR